MELVAEFACLPLNLVIDVDRGRRNWRKDKNDERTVWLERKSHQVLRFWNNDVLENIEGVLEEIVRVVSEREPRVL